MQCLRQKVFSVSSEKMFWLNKTNVRTFLNMASGIFSAGKIFFKKIPPRLRRDGG
jgi:hypothetical protein